MTDLDTLKKRTMTSGATTQSLSARAALGMILSKAIFMLRDLHNVGLVIQLVKEGMRVLEAVFRVEANPEMTELLHLLSFAYDAVSSLFFSLKTRF